MKPSNLKYVMIFTKEEVLLSRVNFIIFICSVLLCIWIFIFQLIMSIFPFTLGIHLRLTTVSITVISILRILRIQGNQNPALSAYYECLRQTSWVIMGHQLS